MKRPLQAFFGPNLTGVLLHVRACSAPTPIWAVPRAMDPVFESYWCAIAVGKGPKATLQAWNLVHMALLWTLAVRPGQFIFALMRVRRWHKQRKESQEKEIIPVAESPMPTRTMTTPGRVTPTRSATRARRAGSSRCKGSKRKGTLQWSPNLPGRYGFQSVL